MPRAVSDTELILQYTGSARLPGGLPAEAFVSYGWLSHCVVSDHDIVRFGGASIAETRRQLTKQAYNRLHRTISTVPVDPDLFLDTRAIQAHGESLFGIVPLPTGFNLESTFCTSTGWGFGAALKPSAWRSSKGLMSSRIFRTTAVIC